MNRRLFLSGSLRVLTRNKLRSSFMGIGVVVGVAALVVMRSIGTSAEEDLSRKLERMLGASSIIVGNSGGGMRGGTRKPGKLTVDDVEAIAAELDTVIDWDPVVVAGNREVRYQGHGRSLKIFGHSERARTVWARDVQEGEFFSEADVRAASRVALIGTKTAEALFGDEDPVGQQIRIGSAPFRVKGVLEPQGFDPHGWDRDDEVHVPITTMMRRLLNLDTIGSAKLILSDTGEIDGAVDRVGDILRARHGLADDEPDDFSIYTATHVRQSVHEANQVLTVYLPATAGIALLVAAIVIANIMLIGVRERIPEIGLRKAVGATDRQVGLQFLLESLVLTALSGGIGVGLGVGVLAVVGSTTPHQAHVSPGSIALGLGAALLVGSLAGVLPARRAARQEPVDALR